MATTTSTSTDQTKSVDASLWWDSFSLLLTELENASPSSDLPPHLVKKLKDNHAWFLDTVSCFKPPNEKSREALNSRQVNAGSHKLTVEPELKDVALKISSILCLDEVQAYILVKRSIERSTLVMDYLADELLHLVMLQYYIERQCLLKCTRQIVMHALYVGISKEGSAVMEEAQKLLSDGLESRLHSNLEDLLSSSPPENMDVDLFTLWAEETLIEDNLVLDILFLAYYECHCRCTGKQWKKLCSLYEGMISGSSNFGRLAMSTEALQSIYHAKVQLLLILIETLDLENLLQMIHDEMPFSQGSTAFSLSDILELDATISSFSAFEEKETGPLILSWAVFLCLISSLPGKEETNVLMDIDHVGYVRQAFEVSSLSYFLEILQSDILKDSDGPIAGYRSVLRTFISAFIASYEISLQLEDNTRNLILAIICKIYRGEESLCIQFWDKDSFIDGPIRCLLCNLEGEFPFRTVELVRLLSSLCEGTWPAECVYNFLDKSVGISSVFEISNASLIDEVSQIVETSLPLSIPGVDGLLIPSNTRGHILKVIDGNAALIRWEYGQSGVLVLLLRLAQKLYLDCTEEVLVTLDLLSRLVSFNMAVCHGFLAIGNSQQLHGAGMNGHLEMHMCINVVDIMCTLVKKSSPNSSGAVMMSMGVNILAKMLKCSPSRIAAAALNTNIFDVALKMNPFNVRSNSLSSGSWLLSGRLANMLLIDCEHNDNCCQLTLSVLDFTMQLVQTGVENDVVLALVVFAFQYVLVNHEYWKYKLKHARWNVTLKVLKVMEMCILSIPYRPILGEVVRDILFCDSSIHSALFRVVCTTAQALEKLYVSRLYDPMEIEGLQLAICSVLDILSSMLSYLSKNVLPSLPVFHQAVLSAANKPIPVVTAMISLLSYFRNPKIQVGAAKVLSVLFVLADCTQPYVFGNAWFGLDEKQMMYLKRSLNRILCELSLLDEDLFVATCKLLTSAAYYQPAFLVAVIAAKENIDVQSSNTTGLKPSNETTSGSLESAEANLLVAILQYVMQSDDLINSKPRILLNVLNFIKALWQAAAQFTSVLDRLRNSENFWRHLSSCFRKNATSSMEVNLSENLTEEEVLSIAYRIQCQSVVLQILAFEMFLQKKLFHAEFAVKQTTESSKDRVWQADDTEKSNDAGLLGLKDVLSSFHEGLVLGNMIKSYASWEYDSDMYLRAKIAAALFSVHAMGKLKNGDTGSLSVAVIEKTRILLKKLSELPSFSELVAQYTHRGHSEGKDMHGLIISDLYYHLQAELEGRKIDPGPFKELSQYLLESNIVQTYRHKYEGDLFEHAKDVYLFDTLRLREELGFNLWDYSDWKASKAAAETMLLCLQDVNYMVLLASSKLSALKSLITVLSTKEEDSSEKTTIGRDIPQHQIHSCIDQVCQCLQSTIESLVPFPDISEDVLDFTATQAELLLLLIRYVGKSLPLPVCVLVLKTSGSVLKVLNDFRPLVSGVKDTMKLLLMLLLSSVKSSCKSSQSGGAVEMESVEAFPEVSNVSLGLLPILCHCTEPTDHCTLSLAIIDLVLKGFLTPNTWFPILKKHLRLQHLVLKLQDRNLISSIPIILKFLLTVARVRDGATMLFTAGFLPSLKMLFSDLSVGNSSSIEIERSNFLPPEKIEMPRDIWGLGLAVVTAMIHSLGDSSSGANIVDYVITYFILEKGYLISHYLNAPEFPFDDHDKKRARSQKTPTSLNALRETEHTLTLICELVKHRNSWMKAMKEMDSPLRERSIHLLAFISRGAQNFRVAPLVCHPVLKEELKWCNEPSVINSRCGWFALTSIDCGLNPRFSAASSKSTALVVKDQGSEVCQTYFSDTIAIQIYRIAFLILKFLCLQAECAIRRAEEVGFIDLAHFPELPMPEILHGLQDQGIAIVTEWCEANKTKQVSAQIQGIFVLLLHTTEMALYLEYCVSQICEIRPVLGHVEDFSKGIKSLMKATEGHAFLKGSVKSLKHVVSFVFPGLLQTEGLL
ncbi:uncharacterized protein LOC131325082 isoform X1 [Rhododendron vialii]|uniref:uncharacterized protein LOC131325082 isoform X1 n=2 Tax=Rhododendron vialii TaxID=182163 RepID=UPI00265E50FA|nr:uncharacterized protein LOC131325082 isoform X1 [Rhododendron vialii]